jgi:2',3'-cyclic-nucleotide 2'-phosphodiesterase (5'-nucleotidase family)
MFKKDYSKKLLVLLLSLMLVLPGFTPALAQESQGLTIYHTNDVHARVEGTDTQVGYGKIAGLVLSEKNEGKNVLLLDAGDATHGQSIAILSEGESIIKLMNLAGYDGMTAGNHDFNYGKERLSELKELADFPLMGANVLTSEGKNYLDDYFIKEIAGKKILILGLSTPETLYKSHPKNTEGLVFIDPAETAKQILATNRSKVDFVIALSHLGQEGNYTSKMLAEKVSGIDLIIDGHSHDKGEIKVGNTVIVQTGEYGGSLGKVEITFTGDTPQISSSILEVSDLSEIIAKQDVLDLIAEYQKEVDLVQSEVIGRSTVKLEGTRDLVRTSETNLGNLITDAILSKSGADLVLTNGGGIRASIEAGDITRKNVFDVLPFGNLIAVKEVPGSVIKDMLEFSVRLYPESNGGFLHSAGLTFAFDESKEPLSRVHDIKIQGKALEANKMYKLATNDFMAAGGDGYTMMSNYPIVAEMVSLEEALADYIAEIGGTISIQKQNRIRVEAMKDVVQKEQNIYIVKSGDSLSKIAAQYGMTWQDLQKVNNLKNPNLIFPEQKIIIPAA